MSLTRSSRTITQLAERGAVVDYAFHMILCRSARGGAGEGSAAAGQGRPRLAQGVHDLRPAQGRRRAVARRARRPRATTAPMVCVHAENHGMITWMGKRLLSGGYAAPKFHAISHPRLARRRRSRRPIACAALVDQPIMIFHVSTAEGAGVIRRARGEGLKVFAETCPQYLFLTRHDLDKPGLEGAKWMCSPPAREASDQEALWQALELGDLQVISSDHAPYAFDESGKLEARQERRPSSRSRTACRARGAAADGVRRDGVERPLRRDEVRRAGPSTEPAKIYGLYPKKGTHRDRRRCRHRDLGPEEERHLQRQDREGPPGYTPWKGRTVKGWPTTVLLRGEVLVAGRESCKPKPGSSGQFLARQGRQGRRAARAAWRRSSIRNRIHHVGREPEQRSVSGFPSCACGALNPQTAAASSPPAPPAPPRRAAGSRR